MGISLDIHIFLCTSSHPASPRLDQVPAQENKYMKNQISKPEMELKSSICDVTGTFFFPTDGVNEPVFGPRRSVHGRATSQGLFSIRCSSTYEDLSTNPCSRPALALPFPLSIHPNFPFLIRAPCRLEGKASKNT